MPDVEPAPRGQGAGLVFAIAAYVLWGLLPVYFLLLAPAGPFEVVAFRILCSLVFCVILLLITRGWAKLGVIVRHRRSLVMLGVAGAVIYVNWQLYVIAVLSGRVVEASLGYFINPIVTVLLGVVILRERLRPAQWAAVGISAIAILVIAIGYGAFPWIAVVLAFSFATYGFIKKGVGERVDAISGLTLETAWLTPVAIVQLVVVGMTSGLTAGHNGILQVVFLLGTGIATATPLLLFAAGARRLPLVSIGLTQYFAPVLQFLIGILFLHEHMSAGRWIGFALVWIALIILTVDLLIAARGRRGSVDAPASPEPV